MEAETKQVVERHIAALRARDVNKLMKDYAGDAFFMSNLTPGAICGLEALRQFWTQALAIFTPEVLSTLKFQQQENEGDVVYLQWSAGTTIPFGSDTFVVRDGKIAAQTATVQIVGPN